MNIPTSLNRLLAVGATLVAVSTASALQLNYDGSGTGSTIVFNGNSTFTFNPSYPSNNFTITSTLGGTNSANGLTGSMGGTFTIGTVTTSGSTNSAPVTGSGSFLINDGVTPFNATLNWSSISQTGTGGILNTFGAVNLTNITYAGSNTDLLKLKGPDGVAFNVLTFNFVPAISLADLKTTQTATSFSGSLAPVVPDGGLTVAMLGFAMTALALIRRKLA